MEELRTALEAIKLAALSFGIKKLAPDLDKAPSTLYDELNLSPGSKAKLGCEDALRIMHITGDHSALHSIASAFGYTLLSKERDPDGKNLEDECLQGVLAVSAYVELARTSEHYTTLSPSLTAAIQELQDIFVRRRVEDLARAMVNSCGTAYKN